MADKRFFDIAGPFTLGQLAEMTGSELSDPVAARITVSDVSPLHVAGAEHIGFLDNKKYVDAFRETKAGACFVRPELAGFAPAGTVCLTHKNPYMAYAIAAAAFYPTPKPVAFRAATAVIDPSAVIGSDCHIGENVVIGANVRLGDRCRIGAAAVIGDGVVIGDDATIHPRVCISHALIGNRVCLHPGVVVGSAGFGFAIDPATGFHSVPQLGRVVIGDDVDIGANSTIDRGAGPDTVIGQGTRLDNLVQIAHNAKLGKYVVMAAQSGVSGSTTVGDYVMIGGQVGIAGHLNIGSFAKIAAQSGIMRDVAPKENVMGSPAVPMKQFMRQVAMQSRLYTRKTQSEEK